MSAEAGASDRSLQPLPDEELHGVAAAACRLADHGRLEDAQALLEGLVSLEPERPYLHTTLGCLYMKLGRDADALAEFDVALAQEPGDVAALTCAGELRLERGERERGLELLAAAAAADPGGADPHAQRARALQAQAAAEAR